MRVKIYDRWYSTEDQPICIQVSEVEQRQIAALDRTVATKGMYAVFPDSFGNPGQMVAWMKTESISLPSLADDSLVDPAIAQVAATLWNEKDGRMCSAVQLLVRPLDVRGDEAGGHPGEEFVMVTITRDELRAILDFVEEDWRRTVQCAGDPNQK